ARLSFLKSLAERLNGDLYYQKIFEPCDADDWETATESLADDLTDICFDVKEGLMRLPEDGLVPAHVVWRWTFNLEIHWGRHAVSAISTLHSLLFGSHALS